MQNLEQSSNSEDQTSFPFFDFTQREFPILRKIAGVLSVAIGFFINAQMASTSIVCDFRFGVFTSLLVTIGVVMLHAGEYSRSHNEKLKDYKDRSFANYVNKQLKKTNSSIGGECVRVKKENKILLQKLSDLSVSVLRVRRSISSEKTVVDNFVYAMNESKVLIDGKRLSVFKQGREYKTEAGLIDLLCIDDDRNLYVLEFKYMTGGDSAVGQTQRYMASVKKEFKNYKSVKGIILTNVVSQGLIYSFSENPDISLIQYGEFKHDKMLLLSKIDRV